MNIAPRPTSRHVSRFGLALGLLAIILSLVAWWNNTARYSHLISAMAFAALMPSWCLLVDWTIPLRQQFKMARQNPLPVWAARLVWLGMALLFFALFVRFVFDR